jgi:hypothetical protein
VLRLQRAWLREACGLDQTSVTDVDLIVGSVRDEVEIWNVRFWGSSRKGGDRQLHTFEEDCQKESINDRYDRKAQL